MAFSDVGRVILLKNLLVFFYARNSLQIMWINNLFH